jgi:hypothetical protein
MSRVDMDMCVKPCCTLKADSCAGRGTVQFSFAQSAALDGQDGDTLIVGPKQALVRAFEDGSASAAWFAQSGHIPAADPAATAAQLRAIVGSLKPGADVTHGGEDTVAV